MCVLFTISFSPIANESTEPMTMAKCSAMAGLLKLQDDAVMFLGAYAEIKGLETIDDEYTNHSMYISAFIDGNAAGTGKSKASTTRDFYYGICKGTVFTYAKDLYDTRRKRLNLD